MFTKFFILLVIGCTLTFADSRQERETHALVRQQARGIFGTLGSWIKKATDIAMYPYRKAFDILVQTAQGLTDFGTEKVQQVMQKYHDIKEQYQQNLDYIKNEIIKRAIGEMQNIVDILAAVADMKTCDEMKQSNQDLAASGKEALDKLEQDLEEAVDAELKNLQDELDNWQVEADSVIKETEEKGKKKN